MTHENTSQQPSILSIVPTIGPLHISLNSREHIVNSFYPFFKSVYHSIFPNSKLTDKPKPWGVSLIFQIVYGGWTLIRQTVMQKFYQFKDPQYGTLLNLLNNYIPLLLSIYSISFKLNHFSEYFHAIIRIWIMFTCLQRRHYNKAPLVWIDMCLHWGNYCFLTISFNFLKLNVPKYSRIWYKKIAQVLREGSFSTCRGKRIGCVIFPTMCSNIPTKNTILPLRCHCNIKPDNTKKM